MSRARLFEIFGLGIILIAIGWQVFIEDVAKSQVQNGQLLILNEKLNTTWPYLRELGISKSPVELREAHQQGSQYFEQTKTFLGRWPDQANTFSTIRAVLYLFGSFLIIFGKIQEYRYYKSVKAD